MATQLEIPGVDYCMFALRRARKGIEIPWWHIRCCSPCLLEYCRIIACVFEWKPVSHDRAQLMFSEQARMFRDGKNHYREYDYQMFYAHLSKCIACTQDFALIVAGLAECDNNIIGRHWPLPANLPPQNGHYSNTI